MRPAPQPSAPLVGLVRRRAGAEGGFTMIEVVLAATIFLIVAASLAGVLVSGLVSHTTSRERTRAEQIGQAQIERARKIPYDNVGTPSGNPPGTIPAAGYPGTVPSGYTVAIDVERVQDPTPTANATTSAIFGDYKKMTVRITRTRDGKQLALLSTLVSPPSRQGGINGAALRVTVKDWALPPADGSSSIADATVTVANGPSSDRSDTTDERGQVEFLALLPTNASPPQDYYDVTVAKTGYATFAPDTPPAAAAHVQLAPTQVGTTTIRIFKPATIVVALRNGATPYALPATVKVHSAKTGAWTTYTVDSPDGLLTLTSIGGEPIYPNVVYTVYAYTPTGLCAAEVQQNVPDDYPNDLDTTFDLSLGTCPSADLTVDVTQLGSAVSGAAVTLAGGPNDVSVGGTTGPSGNVTFANVPTGTAPYTVTASKTIQSVPYTGSASTVVDTDPDTATVALADPATATVNVTVNAGGAPLAGAQVTLAGSPFGLTIAPQTTNGSGIASFPGVAVGSGYSITATHAASGLTGTQTGVTVAAPTTSRTITMPEGQVSVTATQLGVPATNAAVTLSGGPLSITRTQTATTGSTTFANVPAGSGYTISATRVGQTGTATAAVTDGATTPVAIAIPDPPTGSVTVGVTWAGLDVSGASVRLQNASLGYDETQSTSASGTTTFSSVPAGSSYTITATASGQSASNGSFTVAAGSNSTSLALPTVTLSVRVRRSFTNQVGATVKLSGGPMALGDITATTNGSGIATYTSVPRGSGYTIKAYANPCTSVSSPRGVTATNQTVNTSPTTSITVTYANGTCPQP